MAPVITSNSSDQKQLAQGRYFKEKHTKMKIPNMNWITPDSFILIKAAVEVSLGGDKGQITILTDSNIPECTLRRLVPTFSGILKKYVRFKDITIGMVYPLQADDCVLLPLSDGSFLKQIIIERDNANDGIRRLDVISIIVQMSQCKYRGTCAYHCNYIAKKKE